MRLPAIATPVRRALTAIEAMRVLRSRIVLLQCAGDALEVPMVDDAAGEDLMEIDS
jgi:hypothetical protein